MSKTTNHIRGLHRHDQSEREKDDFYATDVRSILPLLEVMGWLNQSLKIRDNCCGAGHLSIMLEYYGHQVISSDLINRGYGIPDIDFLSDNILDGEFDATVMNPPYKLAVPFIEKSISQSEYTCAFLRITFLEGVKKKAFFDENPPKYVAVFRWRVKSSKHGLFDKKEKSATCYAWFIWKKGYKGEPIIKWI